MSQPMDPRFRLVDQPAENAVPITPLASDALEDWLGAPGNLTLSDSEPENDQAPAQRVVKNYVVS